MFIQSLFFFFLFSSCLASCTWYRIYLPRDIVVNLVVDTQLLPDDVGQARTVTQIYPVAAATALLGVLALLQDNPVEAFGARDGRAEPDLFVRRLFVEYVAELLGDEVDSENAGLDCVSVACLVVLVECLFNFWRRM